MSTQVKCLLCQCEEAKQGVSNSKGGIVYCPRCGTYWLARLAHIELENPDNKGRLHLLSGLSRAIHDKKGEPLSITSEILSTPVAFEREVASRVPSDIGGKTKAILHYIADHSERWGQAVAITPANDYPVGFCRAEDEFRFLLLHLKHQGLLTLGSAAVEHDDSFPVSVTAKGWSELSGDIGGKKSDQCFVAMWFDDSVTDAFVQGIKPLEETTGFTMTRIDQTQFNDKICDRIMAEIKGSRFMIADVTGHRHAVYFEAGYAMGLGLPIIWCCKTEEIGKCPNFDTRQYNHILWDNPEDLKQKLQARIEATILTQEEIRARKANPS